MKGIDDGIDPEGIDMSYMIENFNEAMMTARDAAKERNNAVK